MWAKLLELSLEKLSLICRDGFLVENQDLRNIIIVNLKVVSGFITNIVTLAIPSPSSLSILAPSHA